MQFAHIPPLAISLFSLLTTLSLLFSFVMLGSRWISSYLYAFSGESLTIAALSAAVAYYGGFPELYLIAILTALFRGIVLPFLIWQIVRSTRINRELHIMLQPSTSLVLGAFSVVLALIIAVRIGAQMNLSETIIILALTIMLSMKLIGFLILTLRYEAISQVLGLLVLENGIFLGSQLLVPGMPMLLELVILFDLLVAVACFGVMVRYLLRHVGSTDTMRLRRLVG